MWARATFGCYKRNCLNPSCICYLARAAVDLPAPTSSDVDSYPIVVYCTLLQVHDRWRHCIPIPDDAKRPEVDRLVINFGRYCASILTPLTSNLLKLSMTTRESSFDRLNDSTPSVPQNCRSPRLTAIDAALIAPFGPTQPASQRELLRGHSHESQALGV
jgi:hypothetical protein